MIGISRNLYVQIFKSFQTPFPAQIDIFSFFVGGVKWTAKNFTFCWFWLGKMHQNGLSVTYLGFEVCQIQWHLFQVSTISIYDKWFLKNQNFRQKFHILLILTGKNASKWLEWHVFRVWDVPNPMALVSSLYNKQFPKNQNFRQKFHILLILTGKNAKMHAKSNGTWVSTISGSWDIKIYLGFESGTCI